MFVSPPERTFHQNLTWRLLALFPALVAWGIALGLYADANKVEPISAVIAAVLTALTVWVWIAAAKAQLSIHSEGVQIQGTLSFKEMRWEEISETRFHHLPAGQQAAVHFGLLGYLIARVASRGSTGSMNLFLKSGDGRKLNITSTWREVPDAIRMVLRKVNPRIKEDIRRRVRNGETVMFGKVGLSQQGVVWKDKPPIPFATLAKCRIDGVNLRIKTDGKWLDNIAVATSKVPDVFVFLDLVDELKSGGEAADVDPVARATGVGAT